jgi:hypothetical protein
VIAANGDNVFWADTILGELSSRPGAGGATPITVSTPTTHHVALAAAVDGIVLLSAGPPGLMGGLQQWAVSLATSQPAIGLSNPHDVTVAGTAIYWTESAQVSKGAIGASTSSVVASGETGCESIAANAAGAYWTRPNEGLVRSSVPVGGTVGASSLAEKEVLPSSIAADDTDVYWLTGDGRLRRKTIGQELPPATLAKGFASAFAGTHVKAIALTSMYVVWITTDGRVLRVAK